MNDPHTGSNFDDFLKDEGIYEIVDEAAQQRIRDHLKELSDEAHQAAIKAGAKLHPRIAALLDKQRNGSRP